MNLSLLHVAIVLFPYVFHAGGTPVAGSIPTSTYSADNPAEIYPAGTDLLNEPSELRVAVFSARDRGNTGRG